MVIGTVGLLLILIRSGEPPERAVRAAAVPGAVLAAALLLDLVSNHRDRLLLPLVAILATVSVVVLSRIDLFLATKQIMWVLMGSAAMVGIYFLIDDIRALSRLKYAAGAIAVALLSITVVWGTERHGARLWLSVPGVFSFQAGEVAKLLVAIFLAGYVADVLRSSHRRLQRTAGNSPGGTQPSRSRRLRRPPQWRPAILLLIIVIAGVGLFVGQRDLGAAALFFGLFVVMLYLGTGRTAYVGAGAILFIVGIVGACYAFPHTAQGVQAWLNPWQAPQGSGYQPLQALFCLAEGGLSGTGLGQVSLSNLPAAGTDLILAAVGHDLGLLGTVALVLIYALLCFRAYNVAWLATDSFGALLAAALATMFALQSLMILGGVVRLVPPTGITLPFLSYGGTSMVVNFIAIGLLLAVARDCIPSSRSPEH